MNRKTFLASLAGLVAAPLLAKIKPAKAAKAVQECAATGGKIKAVMFVNKSDLSMIQRCEEIRKEMEAIAEKHYSEHWRK